MVSKDVYLTDASDARAQANASPNATGIYDILSSGLVHRAMAKCYAQSRLQAWLSTDVAQTGRPEVDAFLYSLIAWTEQPPTTPSVKRARDDLHQLLSRGHINTAEYVALESRIDLLTLFGKRVLATLYLSYSTFLLRNAEQFGRPDLEAMRQTQAAMLALRDGHMFDRSDMANINTAISRLILQRLG